MRTVDLFLLLSAASLVVMVIVDAILGPRAELLNAFSALQRLFGQAPSAGDSVVARRFGEAGELVAVLAVNLLVGGILTAVFRLLASR